MSFRQRLLIGIFSGFASVVPNVVLNHPATVQAQPTVIPIHLLLDPQDRVIADPNASPPDAPEPLPPDLRRALLGIYAELNEDEGEELSDELLISALSELYASNPILMDNLLCRHLKMMT